MFLNFHILLISLLPVYVEMLYLVKYNCNECDAEERDRDKYSMYRRTAQVIADALRV